MLYTEGIVTGCLQHKIESNNYNLLYFPENDGVLVTL